MAIWLVGNDARHVTNISRTGLEIPNMEDAISGQDGDLSLLRKILRDVALTASGLIRLNLQV